MVRYEIEIKALFSDRFVSDAFEESLRSLLEEYAVEPCLSISVSTVK